MIIRKLLIPVVCSVVLSLGMTACKTTEENYQRAYDVAKAKKTEGLTAEEAAGFKREAEMPKTVYKGDSIPLKSVYVRYVEGGGELKHAKVYNVVVASFRQRFNAMSVFNRLKAGGYPDAIVLADRDERYYIGAVTTSSLDTAVIVLETLRQKSPVALTSPYPYILKKP